MAAATIDFLCQYPVKGLSGQPLDAVDLVKGAHFPGDRLYAIENGPSGFDPAQPAWQSKIKFLCLMKQPQLAALSSHYDGASGVLRIERDGRLLAAGDLGTAGGRATIEMFFAAELGDSLRGAPRVLTAPAGFRFMDSARSGFVSLLNLASVRALAAMAGRRVLEPERFRMNIGIEGLPPWGEFDLVGRTVRLGGARLKVLKPTERCAAINARPGAGQRDLNLPHLMMQQLGHADCGIYAEVVEGGRVQVGDVLNV